MEEYKKNYVNGLFISEKEYKESLKRGNVEVVELTYKDGEIISIDEHDLSVKDFDKYQIYIDGHDLVLVR